MKTLYKILPLLLIATVTACSGSENSVDSVQVSAGEPAPSILDFQNAITEEWLFGDLSVLAHDSLEGRDTGSPGLEKAAAYLSRRYRAIGLTPVGDNNTYLQHYNLVAAKTDSLVTTIFNTTTNSILEHTAQSAANLDRVITGFGGSAPQEGTVVFAGFGAFDEGTGINQIGENIDGKWVMVFDAIPTEANGKQVVPPGYNANQRLRRVLLSSPAVGMIVVAPDVETFEELKEAAKPTFEAVSGMALEYLSQGNTRGGFPKSYYVIHPELAAEMLGLNSVDELAAYESEIASDPFSFEPKELPVSVKHTPYIGRQVITTSNVVAFFEGSDPQLKDEVVVLSSHYDHVGIGNPNAEGDRIYNGADDDGSGTAALVSVAQALSEAKKAGLTTKRSILFLNVSGEEKGLLGSRYYSDHPVFPIENTVANINVDMIGRIDDEQMAKGNRDYVYIIGGEIISSGLDSLVQLANQQSTNIELSKRYNDLNDPNQFYRRSDHWNFGRLGVPFVFFFNGVHADYHQPSDHVEKIEFDSYLKRTKLLFSSVVMIANSDIRPLVDNEEFIRATRSNPR